MVFISVDASEVHTLTLNLERAPERLKGNLDEVFKNEASALQRDMKRDAQNHRYLPDNAKGGGFARQMTAQKVGPLEHIIGFNKRGAGKLANIIVFGSVNNAPVYNFYGPLMRRTPFFVEHIARIAEDSIFSGPGEL